VTTPHRDRERGKIPGWEYITYADDGSGRKNVTLMVQVPTVSIKEGVHRDRDVSARGVSTGHWRSGEWALSRVCAVAYTDKGTGNGCTTDDQHRGADRRNRTDADTAGAKSIFTPTSATPNGRPSTPPRRTGWLTNTRIRSITPRPTGQQHAAGHSSRVLRVER